MLYFFRKIFHSTKTSISIIRRSVFSVWCTHVAVNHTDNNKLGLKGSERRQMKGKRQTTTEMK